MNTNTAVWLTRYFKCLSDCWKGRSTVGKVLALPERSELFREVVFLKCAFNAHTYCPDWKRPRGSLGWNPYAL